MSSRRLIVALCLLLQVQAGYAADWYVGPNGNAGNRGTRESPWDIGSALDGRKEVQPGDTVYLLEGTYRRRPKELFDVRLKGAADKPIHVRPAPGQRARIDGGLAIQSPSSHVWIRDLEIFVSEPEPEQPVSAGSSPPDLKRPWGGVHMHGGTNCKYINLVIHHCNQGISCWKGEIDCEIYGCLVYENGWLGVDRGHGHCVYTQNKDGVKRIENCIFTCKYDGQQTVQAYGSKNADVDNYLFQDNIAHTLGRFLIGGGRPSHNVRAIRNYLYGVNLQLGYDAPYNEDCEVRDNLIVNGTLNINRFRTVVNEGNVVIPKDAPRPAESRHILLPNRYDPNRAHLAIFNFAGHKSVAVSAGEFLKDGQKFVLKDPKDFFGKSVAEGACKDGKMLVSVPGEFAVFVVIKTAEQER